MVAVLAGGLTKTVLMAAPVAVEERLELLLRPVGQVIRLALPHHKEIMEALRLYRLLLMAVAVVVVQVQLAQTDQVLAVVRVELEQRRRFLAVQ
jgi:hypothetical protein